MQIFYLHFGCLILTNKQKIQTDSIKMQKSVTVYPPPRFLLHEETKDFLFNKNCAALFDKVPYFTIK